MLNWLTKNKDHFTKENERIAKDIYKDILDYSLDNKYKARIILEYISNAFKDELSIQDLYSKIYLNSDELEEVKKIKEILSFETPFKHKKFKHYKGGTYDVLTTSIPVKEINGYEHSLEVLHTEDSELLKVYHYKNFYYHDYNEEVLIIYYDQDKFYARPYEMFFGMVEQEGMVIPRFKKIE